MANYGLTSQGFVILRQDQIIQDMGKAMVQAFGPTTNTANETLLGQLIGILSEREALLWEAMDDLVSNAFPAGAEGIYVDNLLAYSGLTRLPAEPTRTNPTPAVQADGRILYGLVLYGTPGTVVPAGSVVQSNTIPTRNFTLDAPVTIQPAANALQRLYLSNTPTSGQYQLLLACPSGAAATTLPIAWNAQPQATVLSLVQLGSSGQFQFSVGQQLTTPLSYGFAATDLQAAIQALTGYASVGVTGSQAAGFVIAWPQGPIPLCETNSTGISFAQAPTSGFFTLKLNNATSAPLAFNCAATDMQAALRALAGYQAIAVSGTTATGFVIVWNGAARPLVTAGTSTLDAQPNIAPTSTLNTTVYTLNSLQAVINALVDSGTDSGTGRYPFTDVAAASPFAGQYTLSFGANAPLSGQPSSAATGQGRIVVASNSLAQGGNATNIGIVQAVLGSAAEGIGSATCTETGPNGVNAGQLSIIGSGQTGWTGVVNELDCLTGRNLETDTEALARREAQLASRGNGPLAAVVAQIQQLDGVTAAIGFANTTAAALQRLSFASPPTSGTFMLSFNGSVTTSLPFNASATQVQTALAALPSLSGILVAGSAQYGYQVDFNGSQGGQAQPLLAIAQDTTGAQLAASFGRPPKSIEIVVEGGDDEAIAEAILAAAPGGIATYGAPVLVTTGSAAYGASQIPLASVANVAPGMAIIGQGIAAGSTVLSVAGNIVTMSLQAIGTTSQTPIIINHTIFLEDAANNPVQVSFSRPLSTIIYVNIALTTDMYRTPGVPSSGFNPISQWDPASVSVIQSNVLSIGNAIPIGGVITAKGTNGLVGSFNGIVGIKDYTITFDTVQGSSNQQSISLQAEQVAQFETYNIAVSYS